MKRKLMSSAAALALALSQFGTAPVFAEGSSDDYTLVWSDEFEGNELNRSDWNVELHDPGWVNAELQAYVDSEENIQVRDGLLRIYPKKTTVTAEGGTVSFSTLNFSQKVTAENMGSNPWDVQKLEKTSVAAGHSYRLTFTASSSVPRKITAGVQQTTEPWSTYGAAKYDLTETPATYEQIITPSVSDDQAGVFFNIGKCEASDGETPDAVISVSNVELEDLSGGSVSESYTSGRISTQNKQTFTYGKFEVRARVPEGKGYLPAFWLMANDENVYGQWPRCGEIDCMEVMGDDTTKAYGTIHYGNPHAESQGTYFTAEEDSFSKTFHTYTCEWEPGKISWFIDGVKFHEESQWYSKTEGQGTLTYPAPFDQPFYIILNLAIGGSWVGYPDETTSFDNNPFEIDYVRVYQKESYNEDVEKPEVEVELRDPDEFGNYIINGTFKGNLEEDENWKFMTALGGEAFAFTDAETMVVLTDNPGSVDYSVQLVQAGLPLQKGATYEVSFEACASEERTINVDMKAPDHGYMTYMNTMHPQLTSEFQTFKQSFVMKSDSDPNARLEFNMGGGSSGAVSIRNVVLTKTADPDPNAKEEKTVLADGNYVYNGSFQEGAKHLGYWEISHPDNASVTGYADGRRLEVNVPETTDYLTLSQSDLAFTSGTDYAVSFRAQSDTDTNIRMVIGGKKYKIPVAAGDEQTFSFLVPASFEFTDQDFVVKFEKGSHVFIDDVRMTEDALIKNGSFNAGLTAYEVYVDSSANASYVVDSLEEDNALSVTILNPGDQDWKIQAKQNDVPLIEGHEYELSLDIKSSIDRPVRILMQGGEALSWPVYSDDSNSKIMVGPEVTHYKNTFTMTHASDPHAFLSLCLGQVEMLAKAASDYTSVPHKVVVDNIVLKDLTGGAGKEVKYEDNDPEDPQPPVSAEYTITASCSEGGQISPKGDIKVKEQTDQKFTITPNEGYYVKDVKIDGISKGEKAGSYTFINVIGNHTIDVQFAKKEDVYYTIKATCNEGGTITPNGEIKVKEGSDQSFAITPNDGYTVADVKIDGESKGGNVSGYSFYSITGDHTVEVVFAKKVLSNYTIKVSSGTGGTISPGQDVILQEGSDQTFTITPNAGYEISDVKVDGVSVGPAVAYTFQSVDRNHTISAIFAKSSTTSTTTTTTTTPTTPSTGSSIPKTSTSTAAGWWIGVLAAGLGGLAGLMFFRRKKNSEI